MKNKQILYGPAFVVPTVCEVKAKIVMGLK